MLIAPYPTRLLVYHDCTRDYVMRGEPRLLNRIAPHKTLLHAPPGKGLPIGNLNSQFFANVYLNGLDQFVKHELKCRHYLRYCDDFVLLADSPEQLAEWRGRIEAWLRAALCLELNPKQLLAPVSNGVNFLGYIVRRDYLLVRRRVVNHLRERLAAFEKLLVTEGPGYRRYRFDAAALDELAAVLASYWGHFSLADSFNLRQSIWRRYLFLHQFFEMEQDGRLKRKDRFRSAISNTWHQYRHYRCRFPGDVLFFQVGRFMESQGIPSLRDIFYQPDDAMPARRLGLEGMATNRRGARFGFPVSDIGKHLHKLIAEGRSVTLVAETGRRLDRIKERLPTCRFERSAVPTEIRSCRADSGEPVFRLLGRSLAKADAAGGHAKIAGFEI